MKVKIPEDTDSSSISSPSKYFHPVNAYQEIYLDLTYEAKTNFSTIDHSQVASPCLQQSTKRYLKAMGSKMHQTLPTSSTEDLASPK